MAVEVVNACRGANAQLEAGFDEAYRRGRQELG
jgi:hypothetical protein